MGRMKHFLMKVSEDMGLAGEINDKVIEEAQDRLAMQMDQAMDEFKDQELMFASKGEGRRLISMMETLKNKGK